MRKKGVADLRLDEVHFKGEAENDDPLRIKEHRPNTPSMLLIGKRYENKVRIRFVQFGTTLILALCVWGHVSEIFDHWDNTFKTGCDIEYSTVIVVLIAGAVIAFARVAAALIRGVSATPCLLPLSGSCHLIARSFAAFVAHSPPGPLRI